MKELIEIQSVLNAPKNQYNSFGKYHYRNCEDILTALKPLLIAKGAQLLLTDSIEAIGGRVYVKATAIIKTAEEEISVSAFARESETKKGMDDSQITGSASSYARKYALNGLFLIDDNKDADSMNNNNIPAPVDKVKEAKAYIEKLIYNKAQNPDLMPMVLKTMEQVNDEQILRNVYKELKKFVENVDSPRIWDDTINRMGI